MNIYNIFEYKYLKYKNKYLSLKGGNHNQCIFFIKKYLTNYDLDKDFTIEKFISYYNNNKPYYYYNNELILNNSFNNNLNKIINVPKK
jgi:hypothetical protein